MLYCPECANKVLYDIESKTMRCSKCMQKFSFDQLETIRRNKRLQQKVEHLADSLEQRPEGLILPEDRGIEVTLYHCPECGRDIVADEDEKVIGCSYCGFDGDLVPRHGGIHRPQGIIPFAVTEQSAKEQYNKVVRWQIYRPTGLIHKVNNGGFRPVYMPFRSYTVKRAGFFEFIGVTREAGETQTTIYSYYKVNGRMKSEYSGLLSTATDTMDNQVAGQVMPFKQGDVVPFDEFYLNGYYAFPENKEEKAARNEVLKIEPELVLRDAKEEFVDIGLDLKTARNQLIGQEGTNVEVEERVDMNPVWYMPFRMGKRVSFAMVNGQTGKVATDIPVSKRKFFVFSLLTAVPLFLLFQKIGKTTPSYLYFAIVLASMIMSWICSMQVKDIFKKKIKLNIPFRESRIAAGCSWGVALFGALLLLCYGHADGLRNMFPDSVLHYAEVYRRVYCLLAVGMVAFRFWEMKSTYQAVNELQLTKPNVIFVVISTLATVLYCLNVPATIAYYLLALAMAGYLVTAVIYMIDTHNLLDSILPKVQIAEGGEEA